MGLLLPSQNDFIGRFEDLRAGMELLVVSGGNCFEGRNMYIR